MKKDPDFTFSRLNGLWCVFKMTYFRGGSTGTKVSTHSSYHEAREKAYKLNGWRLPEQTSVK